MFIFPGLMGIQQAEQLGRMVDVVDYESTDLAIWTNDEEVIVRAELPGVGSENVDIQLIERNLRIRVEVGANEISETNMAPMNNRIESYVRLPNYVDHDGVTAKMANGVLEVSVAEKKAAV